MNKIKHSQMLLTIIYFLIFLFAFSQADAGFEFVKIGTTGRADRVSFTKVLLANGHENFANSSNPVITGDNLYAPTAMKILLIPPTLLLPATIFMHLSFYVLATNGIVIMEGGLPLVSSTTGFIWA
jgi:hypothetical protein